MEVGDGDAGGEDGVVGVLGGEGGGRLGGELVELHRGHARVDAGDDLLCHLDLRETVREGGSGCG